jgi:hypothetical protein
MLISIASRSYASIGIHQVVAREAPAILTEIMHQCQLSNDPKSSLILINLQMAFAEELQGIIIERMNLMRVFGCNQDQWTLRREPRQSWPILDEAVEGKLDRQKYRRIGPQLRGCLVGTESPAAPRDRSGEHSAHLLSTG